jgi:multiple sugar transport system permease protein
MGQTGIGPLFDLLRRLGLVDADTNWFAGHWPALALVILSVTWKVVGMQMLLLLGGSPARCSPSTSSSS